MSVFKYFFLRLRTFCLSFRCIKYHFVDHVSLTFLMETAKVSKWSRPLRMFSILVVTTGALCLVYLNYENEAFNRFDYVNRSKNVIYGAQDLRMPLLVPAEALHNDSSTKDDKPSVFNTLEKATNASAANQEPTGSDQPNEAHSKVDELTSEPALKESGRLSLKEAQSKVEELTSEPALKESGRLSLKEAQSKVEELTSEPAPKESQQPPLKEAQSKVEELTSEPAPKESKQQPLNEAQSNVKEVEIVSERPIVLDLNRKFIRLVYSDPETYKGPIVKEWPPGKNRSLVNYVKGNKEC